MSDTNTTFTEEQGVKVTITQHAVRDVVEIDSAETTTYRIDDDFADDTLIVVDTSSSNVALEVEEPAEGTEFDVINTGNTSVGIGNIAITGVGDATVDFVGSANSVASDNGAKANVSYTKNGQYYVSGSVETT